MKKRILIMTIAGILLMVATQVQAQTSTFYPAYVMFPGGVDRINGSLPGDGYFAYLIRTSNAPDTRIVNVDFLNSQGAYTALYQKPCGSANFVAQQAGFSVLQPDNAGCEDTFAFVGPPQWFWAEIKFDVPVDGLFFFQARAVARKNGVIASVAALPMQLPTQQVSLYWKRFITGDATETGIGVLNPGFSDATVKAELYDKFGNLGATTTVPPPDVNNPFGVLQARHLTTLYISQLFPGLVGDQEGMLILTSTQPIVAVGLQLLPGDMNFSTISVVVLK
jgi:hypothetical protein